MFPPEMTEMIELYGLFPVLISELIFTGTVILIIKLFDQIINPITNIANWKDLYLHLFGSLTGIGVVSFGLLLIAGSFQHVMPFLVYFVWLRLNEYEAVAEQLNGKG